MYSIRKIILTFLMWSPVRKLTFGKGIVASLTGNASFPVTSPALADLILMNDELSDAITGALSGDKLKIAERNEIEQRWNEAYVNLSYDIMARSKGDEVMLQSSGFELDKPRTRGGIPETPPEVKASTANLTGAVAVSCSRSRYAVGYQYMYAVANPDGSVPPNSAYTLCKVETRTRQVLTGLTRGQAYSIKASAIGAAGQSPFSNPSVVICL